MRWKCLKSVPHSANVFRINRPNDHLAVRIEQSANSLAKFPNPHSRQLQPPPIRARHHRLQGNPFKAKAEADFACQTFCSASSMYLRSVCEDFQPPAFMIAITS
jgi:hypothetical protein